jgi:hemerythrin-like domain-containing protein
MKPTEQLRHEHEVIKIALAVLDKLAAKMNSDSAVDAGDVNSLLEFITAFADGCHHAKEEGFLFPALISAGLPSEGGPVAVMLSEHDHGRALVKQMVESWRSYSSGNKSAARQFAQAARGYIELLTAHIEKENTILFQIAERVLPPDTEQAIIGKFNQFESEQIGDGRHEQFHRNIAHLRESYLK